jgi:hypothetical protein
MATQWSPVSQASPRGTSSATLSYQGRKFKQPQGRSEKLGAIRKGAHADEADCEKIFMNIFLLLQKTSLLQSHFTREPTHSGVIPKPTNALVGRQQF